MFKPLKKRQVFPFKNPALIIWTLFFLLSIFCLNGHSTGTSESVARGQAKAAMCAACHGPLGVSSNPLWPNLAGQKKDYLIKQLKSFRSGERKDPVMGPMAKTLGDEELVDVAHYFSSLQP